MGRFLGHPVGGPRIVAKGGQRSSSDKLPNGRLGFRVTQTYSSHHDGTDLGNFACGDHIYAPHDGYARNRRDTNGALIVEVTEADGRITAFGHLSRYARAPGPVKRGQLLGYVGSTGLNVGGCHIHLTRMDASRRTQDPWPLLEQNRPARVNAGVNIRNAPNLTGKVYKTTTTATVYTSGWDWVKGGYHGLGAHPYTWRKLWVDGAYRYVARPLLVLL